MHQRERKLRVSRVNKGRSDQVRGKQKVGDISERERPCLSATERRAGAIRKIVSGKWPELDLDAPFGVYAVDTVDLPAIWAAHSCEADAIRAVRQLANGAALYGLSLARHALIDYPVKRPRVERAYEALHKIEQLVQGLQTVTPFDMANSGAAWGASNLFRDSTLQSCSSKNSSRLWRMRRSLSNQL